MPENSKGNEFEDNIARLLTDSGYVYQQGAVIDDKASTDFSVDYKGGTVLLEVKYLSPTLENINLAQNYGELLSKITGVENTFVILPDMTERTGNVIGRDGVIPAIESIRDITSIKPVIGESPKWKLFVAMPFDSKFADTYLVAIQEAATMNNLTPIRTDDIPNTDDIVNRIKEEIRASSAMLADISESNPNVFYEIGFADALNKPIFQICSPDLDHIPFDREHYPTIQYAIGQTKKLGTELATAMADFFQHYPLE